MRQSAATITYSDLLAFAEKQYAYTRQRTSSARSRGVTFMDPIVKEEEK